MMTHLQLGGAFLLMLATTAVMGQEVAYLDLVDVKPRTELRSPPLPPPVCNQDGICSASGNSVGISISCGAEGLGEPRAIKTTLISLDRFAYAADDAAEMEIKIENVGRVDMTIPWSPHLSELQPVDEKQRFHYLSFAVILELANPADKGHKEIIEAAKLYGAAEKPATLTILKPGEWLRLRLRVKLAVPSGKLKEGSDYWAIVVPEFRSETFIPNVKDGGYSTAIANDYPRRLSGPDLALRISEKSEGQVEVAGK